MADETSSAAAARFDRIATEMGQYQADGTADCDSFAHLKAELDRTYEYLEDAHAEDVLVPLLSSPNAYVRLHAATMLLLGAPAIALPVLEGLKAETTHRKISRIAAFTIGQWNNGFLFAYRRSKGRPAPSAKSVAPQGR